MRELGMPAAATARIGAETSESEEARAATARRLVEVGGDLDDVRGKAIFAFAARMRGEAADSLLAHRAGRGARVIIDTRAVVIVADIFLRGMRRRRSKEGERRKKARSDQKKWFLVFFFPFTLVLQFCTLRFPRSLPSSSSSSSPSASLLRRSSKARIPRNVGLQLRALEPGRHPVPRPLVLEDLKGALPGQPARGGDLPPLVEAHGPELGRQGAPAAPRDAAASEEGEAEEGEDGGHVWITGRGEVDSFFSPLKTNGGRRRRLQERRESSNPARRSSLVYSCFFLLRACLPRRGNSQARDRSHKKTQRIQRRSKRESERERATMRSPSRRDKEQ